MNRVHTPPTGGDITRTVLELTMAERSRAVHVKANAVEVARIGEAVAPVPICPWESVMLQSGSFCGSICDIVQLFGTAP